jgi:hypothetical protein
MVQEVFNQLLESNNLFQMLPLLMIIHVCIGIAASIKEKKFKMSKVPNYMINGALYFLFLFIMEYIYNGFNNGDFNSMVVSGVEVLRAMSWFGVIVFYYGKQIYENLCILGMPRIGKFEQEFKKQEEN